jgi:signal transduction histidine kinase
MLRALVESSAVAWPMALTFASVAAVDRVRLARRRQALNRSLHELRRPLQALALCGPAAEPGRGQLDSAIDALAGLDREINGGQRPPRRRVDARTLAEQAVARWRLPAIRVGRELRLDWRAGRAEVLCDPDAISRALDNLIANALEHGLGRIRVEGTGRPGCVRLHVANHSGPSGPAADRDPRRGQGLEIVRSVAQEHGGRFAACRHRDGADAVLELPLIAEPEQGSR